MDERKPSATAAGVALLRVLHQKVDAEPRILRDDVAERLLDPRAVRWAMDHRDQFETPRSRGLRVHVVVRSRYSEDSLAAAAARGVRQLVLLGAGFDTFAFRQPEWAKALRIFEADHPATQEEKRRRVARTELAVPDNLVYAPVDFERETLGDALRRAGLDGDRATFFSCLGVLMYLTEAAVDELFAFLGAFPEGSSRRRRSPRATCATGVTRSGLRAAPRSPTPGDNCPSSLMSLLRGVRSLASVVAVGVLFVLSSLVLRLVIIPGAWLWPARRFAFVTAFMKTVCGTIARLLSLGGARFRRVGTLPTASPVVVVGNHQSLLDIVQVTLLAQPRVPAFVARRRYERFVPLVSACIRLLGCPIVDPRNDAAGALEAIRRGARELPHGLLIFPEGHRSHDGAVQPFRTAGLLAILAEQRAPVYLVLSDGAWRTRRFSDLLFRVHLLDAYSEVLGPFAAPEDPGSLEAFAAGLRETLVARLAAHRAAAA